MEGVYRLLSLGRCFPKSRDRTVTESGARRPGCGQSGEVGLRACLAGAAAAGAIAEDERAGARAHHRNPVFCPAYDVRRGDRNHVEAVGRECAGTRLRQKRARVARVVGVNADYHRACRRVWIDEDRDDPEAAAGHCRGLEGFCCAVGIGVGLALNGGVAEEKNGRRCDGQVHGDSRGGICGSGPSGDGDVSCVRSGCEPGERGAHLKRLRSSAAGG